MGFFSDIGDFGHALVTGRWSGGENSIGDVWNRDPAAVLAPVGLLAGGAALGAGALGGFGALGAGEAGAAGAGAESAFAFAPELAGGEGATGSLPEWLASPTAGQTVADDFGALGYNAPTSLSPPPASIDQLLPPGGAMPVDPAYATPGAPTSLAPGAGAGAGTGASGATGPASAWETLTSPSKWTLGGVAQGAGIGIGALGLGANMLKGNSKGAAEDRLTNVGAFGTAQAQQAVSESKQLRSYLESGTLPGPLQAQVDQAVKAQRARLIANAAKNGVSTDPTQNTALAQDLQAADMMGIQMAGTLEQQLFTAGQQMLTEGLNFAGLSAKMYETLAGFDRTDTANLNQAIANLSGALAKGSGGINLKVA